MEWISVDDRLPDLKLKKSEHYLVLLKRDSLGVRIKIGKREKKLHRRPENIESINKVLKESHLAKWVIANFKGSEVTHWMPLPEPPKD